MKEEPEIVKILKEEEKQGKLQEKAPFSFESAQTQKKLLFDACDKTTMYLKKDFKSKVMNNKQAASLDIENEELYRTLVENVLEGIVILDFKGKILFENPAMAKILGFKSVQEGLGKSILSFVDPKFHKKVIKNQDLIKSGKEVFLDTYQVTTVDGNKIWIEGLGTNIKYLGKTANVVYIRDITDRKEIEESLRASEERFKQLYDKAPVPYHTLSPKGIITNVNDKWCNILKYTKEEVIKKSIFDFIIKSEREEAKKSFEEKIQGKKSYTGGHERTYVTKNGEERIFIIHDYFSFDKNKNVQSVHTTMEDITQRRQIWDKMVKSEEKYRVLAETSADGVLTTDTIGRLTYVNPSLEKILGRKKSKILATAFRDYLSKSSVYLFQQTFLDVRKKNKP
ncbi:MAG: PAS domain S-box protein, partial [Elusimicrobiota bacterium]